MHSSGKQLALNPVVAQLLLLFLLPLSADGNAGSNLGLSRQKRLAIFSGSGTNKLVAGIAFPIKQEDTVQSVWGFINYQAQYVPTPVPIFWWTFWNTTTFVSTARQALLQDDTRLWLYDVVEQGLERFAGPKAGACLLRTICDISQLPFEHSNIFSEILNAVFVPSFDNVPEKYLHARNAGKAGADCSRTYSDCSKKLWNRLIQLAKITI